MPEGRIIRRTVLFSGRVQGVGFRYTTRRIAAGFAVRGYVRNLPDGRVETVVEGEPSQVEAFLSALHGEMGTYIRRADEQDGPATGEFETFEIRA
jgi:acylphosphatase